MEAGNQARAVGGGQERGTGRQQTWAPSRTPGSCSLALVGHASVQPTSVS